MADRKRNCDDCRHKVNGQCQAVQYPNGLVLRMPCSAMRADLALCGFDGLRFEPRETEAVTA